MKQQGLVRALFPEVRQTERSAMRHSRLEALRLGQTPPAAALIAVAEHARREESVLEALAREREPRRTQIGAVVGGMFSVSRDRVADFLLTAEQSYRGTLLGMRHGYDVVIQFRAAARAEGDAEVEAWCDWWVAEREPLIHETAAQMQWSSSTRNARSGERGGPAPLGPSTWPTMLGPPRRHRPTAPSRPLAAPHRRCSPSTSST